MLHRRRRMLAIVRMHAVINNVEQNRIPTK